VSAIAGTRLAYFGPTEVRERVGYPDLIEPLSGAFIDYSRRLGETSSQVLAPAGEEGSVHIKSAWLPGREVFTVKMGSWFAERARVYGLGGSGVIAVFDATTGDPVAILEDEHHLSDVRTAAAGALAARTLARSDSTCLAVLGTGVQAYLQALAATDVLPIEHLRIWGRDSQKAARLVAIIQRRRPALDITVVDSVAQACRGSDVVITATASRTPLVEAQWLDAGTHITAVGADEPGKAELTRECFDRADTVVVDGLEFAAGFGELSESRVRHGTAVELGEVLVGTTRGRTGRDQVTVCKLVGLGIQDLVAAHVALDALRGGAPRRPCAGCAEDLRG
jgi:ornithine cyclodeaminase